VVTVHEADGFGFRAAFEHLRTTEFQIFNQDDAIAVGEDVTVGIFDDARTGGSFGSGDAFPFVTARHAFPFLGEFQHFGHLTHGAGRFTHKDDIVAEGRVEFQWRTLVPQCCSL
jgi:hypothetical protein